LEKPSLCGWEKKVRLSPTAAEEKKCGKGVGIFLCEIKGYKGKQTGVRFCWHSKGKKKSPPRRGGHSRKKVSASHPRRLGEGEKGHAKEKSKKGGFSGGACRKNHQKGKGEVSSRLGTRRGGGEMADSSRPRFWDKFAKKRILGALIRNRGPGRVGDNAGRLRGGSEKKKKGKRETRYAR